MKYKKNEENNINYTTHTAQLCECGRLYKDSIDQNGKMICSACYTGFSVETLKNLWGTPIGDNNDPT